ncbi:MAG: hypothetical protein ACH346_06905 [Chthoniobacterales bacterium]
MTGILISTFDKYEPLARWTAKQIAIQWPEHPPLFFSGLTSHDPQSLRFSGDTGDWMAVTLHAVQALRMRGFTHAYLILDDHPPVGPCHKNFLNHQLPALAADLGAVFIGLLGYGQHRSVEGEVLEKKGFLERCRSDYRWKFSLHPGLWNLEALELLLKRRMELYCGSARTPWNFERHRDDPNDAIVGPMMESCFRVSGKHFLKNRTKMQWQIFVEMMERFIADILIYRAKKKDGATARDKVEQKLLWRYGHYLGPYPLFWSGVMQQGQAHAGFEQWLQKPGNKSLLASWLHHVNG